MVYCAIVLGDLVPARMEVLKVAGLLVVVGAIAVDMAFPLVNGIALQKNHLVRLL